MKILVFLVLLFGTVKLAAQTVPAPGRTPDIIIELTTANENRLRGMLLIIKDSSLSIYPGKPKEWKANKPYKPVSFYYTQIGKISLQKKTAGRTVCLQAVELVHHCLQLLFC